MAAPFHVVVADFSDDAAAIASTLQDIARITQPGARSEADLDTYLPELDGIILGHDVPLIGEATFSRAPRLKCVVRAGVGYNNIDVAAAARHGVVACNVPDYGTEEVADHAIMFLLAVARCLVPCDRQIRGGGWDYRAAVETPRLRGKTFGVVGCGRIGTAAALRAKAFGLDVVF
jgi:C-terminal binding protein